MKSEKLNLIKLIIAFVFLPSLTFGQLAGDIDHTFNYGLGDRYFKYFSSDRIYTSGSAIQPDGKILLASGITTRDGVLRKGLVRFNLDGSLDSTFHIGSIGWTETSSIAAVQTILVQPDGKILIGGGFNSYYSTGDSIQTIPNQNYLARLNADGTLDRTFQYRHRPNHRVYDIKLQSDGKIIIGGAFTQFGTVVTEHIARLNIDGTLDNTFNVGGRGFDNDVRTIAIQTDNKILVGGNYLNFKGIRTSRFTRLHADGSLDTSYNQAVGANMDVNKVAIQPNGKAVIIGNFETFNGIERDGIARINTNGTLDEAFNPGFWLVLFPYGLNNYFASLEVQPDGKILVGGYNMRFPGNIWPPNSTSISTGLVRLTENGELDDRRFYKIDDDNGSFVRSILVRPDGKIWITGNFQELQGKPRANVALIQSNGFLDSIKIANTGLDFSDYSWSVDNIVLAENNKAYLFGDFFAYNSTACNGLIKINPNGSVDTSFNFRPDFEMVLHGIQNPKLLTWLIGVQPNGKLVVAYQPLHERWETIFNVRRLNFNGTVDTSFNHSELESGLWTPIIRPDGSFLLVSTTETSQTERIYSLKLLTANGVLILGSNRSYRFTFPADVVPNINAISQPDGKFLIYGNYNAIDGAAKQNFIRLNADGTLDGSYNSPSIIQNNRYYSFNKVIVQPDLKVLVAGNFTYSNNGTRKGILRLNADGTIDQSFDVLLNGGPLATYEPTVLNMALQTDGKVLLSGNFHRVNVASDTSIVRLNSNGSVDTTINFEGNYITAMAPLPDGNILLAGPFKTYKNTLSAGICRVLGAPCNLQMVPEVVGDTSFCNGNAAALRTIIRIPSRSGNLDSVIMQEFSTVRLLWNTGETTRTINANKPGIYTVRVIENACTSVVSTPFRVTRTNDLGTPSISFNGTDSLTSSLEHTGYQWYWNNRLLPETTRTIPIRNNGSYTVRLRSTNGCTSMESAPYMVLENGQVFKKASFSIYPNPTSGNLNVLTTADATLLTIENAIGQTVMQYNPQPKMELNVSELTKGLYIVKLYKGKGFEVQRLVVR